MGARIADDGRVKRRAVERQCGPSHGPRPGGGAGQSGGPQSGQGVWAPVIRPPAQVRLPRGGRLVEPPDRARCAGADFTSSGSVSASRAISMSASANASSVSTDSVSVGSISIPSSTVSGK